MTAYEGSAAAAGEADLPEADADPGEVELRVPATASQLSMVRALVGAVAMVADFDLDTIADLKLAVDELCSTLIVRAAPGTQLTCRLRVTDAEITVHGRVDAAAGAAPPDTRSFGWQVLETLADSVDIDSDGEQLAISVVKRREPGPA